MIIGILNTCINDVNNMANVGMTSQRISDKTKRAPMNHHCRLFYSFGVNGESPIPFDPEYYSILKRNILKKIVRTVIKNFSFFKIS